jgi:hypothetical protein
LELTQQLKSVQKSIEVLQGIEGVRNITLSDDIILFGKSQADHDATLQAVFFRK